MIVIKFKDGHEFKFHGRIELDIDDEFVGIRASGIEPLPGITWNYFSMDLLCTKDIESIRGEIDEKCLLLPSQLL